MRNYSGFIWLMVGPIGGHDYCHTSGLHENNKKNHVIPRDTINSPQEVVPDGDS